MVTADTTITGDGAGKAPLTSPEPGGRHMGYIRSPRLSAVMILCRNP